MPPLAALVDLLCGDPARAIRGRLAASPVPEVRRLARAFLANLEENGKLLASVFSELAPRFACLDYDQVRRVTARDELDLAGLAARPGALYVGLDLAYADLLAPLTGCLYLHLFKTLADTARAQSSGQLPTPVLAYLDEFGVLVVAADRHPLLARQRRYYRVPALVRRLPGGRAFRPGDPDPLAPFRARRAADPLPDPALGADDPAAPAFDPTGGAAPGDEDLIAGPMDVGLIAASNGGALAGPTRADDEVEGAASGLSLAEPTAVAGLVGVGSSHAVATPPPVAEAPATVSCRAAPGRAGAPPPRPTDTGPGAPAPPGPHADSSGIAPAPPRLSATQRAVLDALETFGRPTSEVSSAALAARTGINRSTVRAALRELRGKLGLDQGADLVLAARAGGLLAADAAGEHDEREG